MSSLPVRSSPLQFLRYLEWSLWTVVVLSELLRLGFLGVWPRPTFPLVLLLAFGALGLSLPQGKRGHKILYTISEFLLVGLAAQANLIRMIPLLYIVIVLRNALIAGRRGRFLVTGLAYGACLLALFERWQYRSVVRQLAPRLSERFLLLSLMLALVLGLTLIFLNLFVEVLLAERRGRDQLALANARLRDYAHQVEDMAILQERNRIAREIHDSLGHALTASNLHLEAALRLLNCDPPQAQALVREAQQLGAQALREVRQSVSTLRAEPLQGKSLATAIATLAADFQRATKLQPQQTIAIAHPLTVSCQTAAYRILQEALTNICKYADATAVTITVQTSERALHLRVSDNGRGFQPEQTTSGFGLQGMRERAQALKGQLHIQTAPGQGCTITAHLPRAPVSPPVLAASHDHPPAHC